MAEETVIDSNIVEDSAVISGNQAENVPGLTNHIPMGEMKDYYKQLWSDKQNLQGLNGRLTHLLAWNRELQEDNDRLQGVNEEWENRYDTLLNKLKELELVSDEEDASVDGGGSKPKRYKAGPDPQVVQRLEKQVQQLQNQLQERDQRLADQKDAFSKTKKDLQRDYNKAKKDLTSLAEDLRRQVEDKEKAMQKQAEGMRKELENKENEMQEALEKKDNQLEQLKSEAQKQGDCKQDRDVWKTRAEGAEKELNAIRDIKTSEKRRNDELVQELQDQLKKAKVSETTRIDELNHMYENRFRDLTQQMKQKVDQYKTYLDDNLKKDHDRQRKELEKEKDNLEKELESQKKEGLEKKIDLSKAKSQLQKMEFDLRKLQQEKEKAEDDLVSVKADLTEQLNDAKKEKGAMKNRVKDLQQENAVLRQKIEVQPEVENYEELISEWERSWDITRPAKKRKRESTVDMRGVNIFRSPRPSDSPIPTQSNGSFKLFSKRLFTIDGFANHDNGGPWLKIKNDTNQEQTLEGYSLQIESLSLDKPRNHLFDSIKVPAQSSVRIVTKDTRPQLENDICWNEGWENIDDEMDVSLIAPDGNPVGRSIRLDVPSRPSQLERRCQIM